MGNSATLNNHTIINMTDKRCGFYGSDIMSPASFPAQITYVDIPSDPLDEYVGLKHRRVYEVVGLPPPTENIIYIVSNAVFVYLGDRDDIAMIGDGIRETAPNGAKYILIQCLLMHSCDVDNLLTTC